MPYNKNKLYKALDYWSRDTLNFTFSEKRLGLVSSSHFEYDFSRKIFLMLYSINWPKFIVRFPLLLEILSNMCIIIVYYPGCDVITFEINLFFLIRLWYMTKKSRQKLKYLENEKSFWGETKRIFLHFWRTFNWQKSSQTWECAFNRTQTNKKNLSQHYILIKTTRPLWLTKTCSYYSYETHFLISSFQFGLIFSFGKNNTYTFFTYLIFLFTLFL